MADKIDTLLAQLPDTGFTHGPESNAAAEYVASHPEEWTPLNTSKEQ